jgi:hypothetical protein
MRIYQRNCHGFIARWFARRGWGGVTLPLPFVTIILYWSWPAVSGCQTSGPCCVPDWIRRHERAHAAQAQRLTWLGFYVVFLWQLVRFGYANHPMERSAREAENAPK